MADPAAVTWGEREDESWIAEVDSFLDEGDDAEEQWYELPLKH
jgi:hypothetical protein